MAKIYKHADEKYMANYELFASASKQYTFTDAAMTKKATKSEVVEMFKQGVVVNYGGKLYAPVACDASSTTASLTLATVSSGSIALVTIASDVDAE